MSGCTDRCEARIARNKATYRQHHCSPRESTDDLMAAVGGGARMQGAVASCAGLRRARELQGLELQRVGRRQVADG